MLCTRVEIIVLWRAWPELWLGVQIWEIGPSHLLQSPVPVHNKILNLHKYINSTGDYNNFFDRYGPQNKAVFSASCNSPELFDTSITITMYLKFHRTQFLGRFSFS